MDALERLAQAVPANVREVCAKLTEAGHQAVTVGGAVRDALLGRAPGDWDVATSARPEQVMKLFRHSIPTGLQHGTVTVVTGKGIDSHVEVTTYRGEGAYSDARRPDHVVFGVPLVEDLARRDLVVNAIAYDPAKHELIDPFDGQHDIANKRLRAVGTAVDRFTEDGLRVMRAVRFAAQLEFDLDPETEAGIPPALPSLAKVSRERVSVELRKTLEAPQPSRGFAIARRTGILGSILPDLDRALSHEDAWLVVIDRAPVDVRLAALLAPMHSTEAPATSPDSKVAKQVALILRELKFSNVEADLAAQLVSVAHCPFHDTRDYSHVLELPQMRRLLARIDRDKRQRVVSFWNALVPNDDVVLIASDTLHSHPPLEVADLAINGQELMLALGIKPGRVVGRILASLLEDVLEDPTRNTREALLARARELELQLGHGG